MEIDYVAASQGTGVEIICMKQSQLIEFNQKFNLDGLFEAAPPLPGITKMYCMFPRDSKTVLRKYSSEMAMSEMTCMSSSKTEVSCNDDVGVAFDCIDFPDKLSDLAAGNFLVAPYEGRWYIGIYEGVVKRKSQKIELKFLAPPLPNSSFQWPSSADRGEYPVEDILCRLKEEPSVKEEGRHLIFIISDRQLKEIEFLCFD